MYNQLFLASLGHPLELPEEAITWRFSPKGRCPDVSLSKKHTFLFLSIQIIHTILSCQINTIYCGSMLGFFNYRKRVH